MTSNIIRDCPICLVPINRNDKKGKKPESTLCGHVYHKICLKKALKYTNKCPDCRSPQREPIVINERLFICPFYLLSKFIEGYQAPVHSHQITQDSQTGEFIDTVIHTFSTENTRSYIRTTNPFFIDRHYSV